MFGLTRVVKDLVVRRNGAGAVDEPDLGGGLRALARVALSPLAAVPRAATGLPDLLRALGARGRAIPAARRQAPDPALAFRALAGLVRSEPEIRGGYLALLTATMDRAVAAEVHPAFMDVLRQIGSDELRLLASLDGDGPHPVLSISSRLRHGGASRVELRHFSLLGVRAGCARPDRTPAYLDNLARLGLVEIRPTRVTDDTRVFEELERHPVPAGVQARIEAQSPVRIGPLSEPVVADVQYKSLFLTAFGRQFRGACAYHPGDLPDGDPITGAAATAAGESDPGYEEAGRRGAPLETPTTPPVHRPTPSAGTDTRLSLDEMRHVWPLLARPDRVTAFQLLPRDEAEDFFFGLTTREQAALLEDIPQREQRSWIRVLAPDDAANLIQASLPERRDMLLNLLDEPTRREVSALLAYAEDNAGGLMNPRYIRLRPDMTVDEAVSYLRRQAREQSRLISYAYVLDTEQKLLGVVSFRQLFSGNPAARVREIMTPNLVTLPEDLDQEQVPSRFSQSRLLALPVVDAAGRMKGIVTADDVVDVVQEEATEDMQKVGGVAALDAPYLEIALFPMIRKRVGWLAALFLGEMLTASAMGYFEHEIARAVVLALFVPLIISSGGNSGSQATTLVIRAMALGEVRLGDWWRVVRREVLAGLGLGLVLGLIGFLRIVAWEQVFHTYGAHYVKLAATVSLSLVGVVLWGTLAGSMLPFLLRRLGADPASASAPFVATLVDVSGLVIYFTAAALILRGTLL